MSQRTGLAVLLVALGALGGIWYASATFTITRDVRMDAGIRVAGTNARPAPLPTTSLTVRCATSADHFVSDSGGELFFGGSWPAEEPSSFCEPERPARRSTAAAIFVLGLAGAGAVVIDGRIRRRQAEPARSAADAAADVHATGADG